MAPPAQTIHTMFPPILRRGVELIIAASRFAHMVFPLWLVMIHYTVVATWLGERDCEQTNLNAFMGYWVAMLIAAGAAAVVDALFIRWSRWWKRAIMAAWSGLLAMAQFTTWSFMRGKPFKCFSDGPVFTYVSGPVFFWIIQAVVVAYAVAMVAMRGRRNLEGFVRVSRYEDGDEHDAANEPIAARGSDAEMGQMGG